LRDLIKKLGKVALIILAVLVSLYVVVMSYFFITLYMDPKVLFYNQTDKPLVLTIRWVNKSNTVELRPFDKYGFRHRDDSSFAVYASEKDDHIYTCATDYEFKYTDIYDYKDDPCCLLASQSCKFATGLYSRSSRQIYYNHDESELKIEDKF